MLSKLKKVELRKAWPHEANDFTQWLAKEESISELSNELGIDIKVIQTEANVGKFKLDILAEEEGTGKKVIIENQLEDTNHDHLGKIITYASGLDAQTIIWIVKDVREEHQQAVDWLNEHTDEHLNFFLVKIEVWQIGDSAMAPKFHIICQPNDWAKSVKTSAAELILTDTKKLQLEFWNKFKEYSLQRGTKLRLRLPKPQHWYDISFGRSDAHISLVMNTRESLMVCQIWISNNKELFQKLYSHRKEIESELKTTLEWMELPEKKASRIILTNPAEIESTKDWESYFEWLISKSEEFQKVFIKYI